MSAVHLTRRAVLGGLAVGLNTPPVRTSRAVTLRVSATPSIFKPTFEQLCKAFRQLHPKIDIELQVTARDQENQVQGTLRKALIGELPDVSFEGLKYLRTLQRRDIAVPLTTMIERDSEWRSDNYSPSLVESTRLNGEILAVSTAVSLPVIYYNATRVGEVLGSRPVPASWDGLLPLIAQLGKTAQSGTLGGFVQHTDSAWIYMCLVASLGGSMMSPDETHLTLADPIGLRALEIYASFGRFGQARLDMGREQARQAFTGGAIALLIDSSSSAERLEKQIGGRFPLATARLPVVPEGKLPANGVAATLYAREPERQAAAWQFIKFVSGPSGQSIIGKSTGYLPANNIVVRRPDLLGSYYESRPLMRPIIENLPYAAPYYMFPGSNGLKIEDVIRDCVTSVVTLAKTPGEAAATMSRAIQKLLPARKP